MDLESLMLRIVVEQYLSHSYFGTHSCLTSKVDKRAGRWIVQTWFEKLMSFDLVDHESISLNF